MGFSTAAWQVWVSLGTEQPQLLLCIPGLLGLCAHPLLPGKVCRLLVPAFTVQAGGQETPPRNKRHQQVGASSFLTISGAGALRNSLSIARCGSPAAPPPKRKKYERQERLGETRGGLAWIGSLMAGHQTGTTRLCQDGSPCQEAESCWQQGCGFTFSLHHTPGQCKTPWRERNKHGLGLGVHSHC